MSKNIKIGKKTFTGVKYISCADEEGVYRKFIDVDDIPVTSKAGAIVSGTVTSLTAEDLAGATNLRQHAFRNCENLESITIPDSVTSIGDSAFNHCSKLTSITIPNSVTSISYGAFWSCSSLKSITIPDSVTSIGPDALKCGYHIRPATITFERTTPPTISSSTFDTTTLAKIIVPAGCGDTYKAATNWAAFADYIEEASAE